MIKKSLKLLLIVAMITISLSCFSACNKNHEHTYKDGWKCDETYHWREATCGDIEIGLKGLHNFVDGVCTLCGYEDPGYEAPSNPSDGETDGETDDDETDDESQEDPELPDDDPSSADRPKPGESTAPTNPDNPDEDDELFDDSFYDVFFSPESDYVRGKTATYDGFNYTELSDEDGIKIGYAVTPSEEKRSESEITIPETYNEKPVIMLDNDAFSGSPITKITLPSKMQIIGERAFKDCSLLNSVTIPSSLWLICREAFVGCRSLTSIDLNHVREIRYAAFKSCPLKKLVIPDTVHTIASGAFFDCGKLTEVTVGTGLKNVGGQAFYHCGAARVNITDLAAWCGIGFVYDNSNPLNCGANLYLNNELVTNLIIPEGSGVNKYGFYGCPSIQEVTIPTTAGKIGKGAFMRCTALRAVHFLEGATELDSYVFGYCNKLTEIVLPDSMKILHTEAFYQCMNLKKVVLGKGIQTMEYDVFPRYNNPPQFCYRGSESEWSRINKHSTWAPNAGKIVFNYKDEENQ